MCTAGNKSLPKILNSITVSELNTITVTCRLPHGLTFSVHISFYCFPKLLGNNLKTEAKKDLDCKFLTQEHTFPCISSHQPNFIILVFRHQCIQISFWRWTIPQDTVTLVTRRYLALSWAVHVSIGAYAHTLGYFLSTQKKHFPNHLRLKRLTVETGRKQTAQHIPFKYFWAILKSK